MEFPSCREPGGQIGKGSRARSRESNGVGVSFRPNPRYVTEKGSQMSAIFRAVAVTLLSAVLVATYGFSTNAQGVKPATTNSQSTADIDRDVWSVFVATVAADDIVRMGEAYFPNAVVVMPSTTSPIKETLD